MLGLWDGWKKWRLKNLSCSIAKLPLPCWRHSNLERSLQACKLAGVMDDWMRSETHLHSCTACSWIRKRLEEHIERWLSLGDTVLCCAVLTEACAHIPWPGEVTRSPSLLYQKKSRVPFLQHIAACRIPAIDQTKKHIKKRNNYLFFLLILTCKR